MSSYDKLGEMLKNAIETGSFPETEKKDSNPKLNPKKNKEEFLEQENFKIESQKKSKNNTKEEKKDKKNNRNYQTKDKILDTSVQKSMHLYKIFNLNYGCTKEELKDSYRNLLKKYHPDNFEGFPETQKMAERKTRELISAFNKLLELIG